MFIGGHSLAPREAARSVSADLPNPGRREMLNRLARSLGGVLSLPLVAASHPIQQHLRDDGVVHRADAQANATEYVAGFLDRQQFETLQALAERIVPGSTKARSGAFIDQLLLVAPQDEQRRFLQALGAFERLALEHGRAAWKDLIERQQIESLEVASTARPGAPSGASGRGRVTVRDHFEHLKGWIVGAYYSSELGMRELGWRENMVFTAFPGCEHGRHD